MATLAELTAQMIALQGQQQSFRTNATSRLRSASQGSPYGTQATRDRLAQWATRLESGQPIPITEIDQFNTPSSLNPEWIYFGPEANYSGMSGTQIGALNAQLRNQYRTQYESFLTMDQQIASLQQQIAAMQNQGSGQPSNGTGTGGGGTPPPQTPPPSPAEPAETRNTQRADRRRLQVAFGSPRFGVGLNIPLGT